MANPITTEYLPNPIVPVDLAVTFASSFGEVVPELVL